jgi:hypothetical protein
MPASTLRQQVAYVLGHRRPGDTVVVGPAASFAFGYYWPEPPQFVPASGVSAVLFQLEYPGHPELVVVHQRHRPELIRGALAEAAARSVSGRVWLVLSEAGDRDPTWAQAVAHVGRLGRRDRPRLVLVGTDPEGRGPGASRVAAGAAQPDPTFTRARIQSASTPSRQVSFLPSSRLLALYLIGTS